MAPPLRRQTHLDHRDRFPYSPHWQDCRERLPDEETKARYLVDICKGSPITPGGSHLLVLLPEPGNTMGFGLLNRQLEVVEGGGTTGSLLRSL